MLYAYDYQCAVCRCKEEKLLQAAHIIAVADGGNDEVSNGVCLCANHHLMLDHGLISIDFDKLELYNVAGSVKNMPWYETFVKKYHNKIKKAKY